MRRRPAGSLERGFTLIEVMIVVILLAILAVIVMPRFTDATAQTRKAAVQTTAQTLRSAVGLYRAQHNDALPPAGPAFWTMMTTRTDATGAAYTTGSATGPFGPYMLSVSANALNGFTGVADANVPAGSAAPVTCGWAYDYRGGAGSGAVLGTDADGLTVIP